MNDMELDAGALQLVGVTMGDGGQPELELVPETVEALRVTFRGKTPLCTLGKYLAIFLSFGDV